MTERFVNWVIVAALDGQVIDGDEAEIARYGLVTGIHTIGVLIGILILGLILGRWETMLLAAVCGIAFRFVSGGAHLKSPLLCFFFSVGIIVGICILADFLVAMVAWCCVTRSFLYYLASIVIYIAMGLLIVDRYVPVDSKNNPITCPQERQRLRLLSYSFVLCSAGFYSLLGLVLNLWTYALVTWLACSFQLFSLTPAGKNFYDILGWLAENPWLRKGGDTR